VTDHSQEIPPSQGGSEMAAHFRKIDSRLWVNEGFRMLPSEAGRVLLYEIVTRRDDSTSLKLKEQERARAGSNPECGGRSATGRNRDA
jgi:hypothetical protein